MNLPVANQASRFPGLSFLKRRLLAKTLFAVGSATVLTAGLIILITVSLTFRQFEQQANESLDELIDAMRSMAGIACFTKDATLAKETAQAFIKNSYVQEVMILAYGTPKERAEVVADLQKDNRLALMEARNRQIREDEHGTK